MPLPKIDLTRLRWVRSSYYDEVKEFERVTKETKRPVAELRQAYQAGVTSRLDAAVWRKLNNTDSANPSLNEAAVRRLLSRIRDVDAIIAEYKSGKVRMPIILRTGAHTQPTYTLVAGNTRLCVARLLKVQPQVVIMTLKPAVRKP